MMSIVARRVGAACLALVTLSAALCGCGGTKDTGEGTKVAQNEAQGREEAMRACLWDAIDAYPRATAADATQLLDSLPSCRGLEPGEKSLIRGMVRDFLVADAKNHIGTKEG